MILYIENNYGKNIMVQARNTSINGFMVEPAFSADIVDGKVMIDEMVFMKSDFENNGIEEIENIETSFRIVTLEDWETVVETEPITITFE